MLKRLQLFLCLVGLVLGCSVFERGFASSTTSVYPSKAMTLICPWAPGGGTDQVAQKVAELLGKELGQPIQVVYRIGGGGVIGFTAGAVAEPNGYTLTFLTAEIVTLHWLGATDMSYKDFTHLAVINHDPAGILVRADSPWQTLEDLQSAMWINPGKLRASGTAKGGIWDLCRIGWLRAIGYKVNSLPWYPSNGAQPALQQLRAGQVDVVICSLPEARRQLMAGQVRALAVMARERDERFGAVPTLLEKGIDFVDGGFRSVALPLGTPSEIVARLDEALAKVVQGSEFENFLRDSGFGWVYLSRSVVPAFLAERDQRFGQLIREAGMLD